MIDTTPKIHRTYEVTARGVDAWAVQALASELRKQVAERTGQALTPYGATRCTVTVTFEAFEDTATPEHHDTLNELDDEMQIGLDVSVHQPDA